LTLQFSAHDIEMMQNAGMERFADVRVEGGHLNGPQARAGERSLPRVLARPERNKNDRAIAAAIFVLTVGYLWIFRHYTSMEPDEGIVLEGAQRILRGQVLYRDFFSYFTPGSYYFLALLFKIFGNSFLVARTALVFFGGVYSTVTYLLVRRVSSQTSAIFIAALVTLTTLPYRFEVLHNWDSTLLACLTVYSAVRWLESPQWTWAFGTGSLASLTCLFEQSKGAGLVLGLSAAAAAIEILNRERNLLNRSTVLGLATGMAWPFLLTVVYFGAQHTLSLMLADWFWPLHHYSLANHVPYGYQNWSDATRHLFFGSGSLMQRVVTVLTLSPCFLVPALPLAAVALLIYWLFQMWRKREPCSLAAHYVLICSTLSGLLFSVVMGRADIIHFMYLMPLFALVLGWLMDGRDIPGRLFPQVRPLFVAYVLVAFLMFAAPLLLRALNARDRIQTRRGLVHVPARDTVVESVQAHVIAGEKILVYPYLPLYYYLTDTTNPTRYEYFQPGMHTPQQADEMLAQITSSRVPVVVFESSFWEKISTSWPETPMSAIIRDPIADYIEREYRTCKILNSPDDWKFLFMVRKDLACP
jgi:4-amino-4-deoxy-L-arabinose transferase-like glycosyltransferase